MNQSAPQPKPLDNRVFGLIFSGIFLVIAFFPMLFGAGYRLWALLIAAAWAIPAVVYPAVLAPLNRLWAQFGQVMHKIINPILMGLIFFLTVFPTAIILKVLGKDPMRRKFDTESDSYWILRDKQDLAKDSFDNQF